MVEVANVDIQRQARIDREKAKLRAQKKKKLLMAAVVIVIVAIAVTWKATSKNESLYTEKEVAKFKVAGYNISTPQQAAAHMRDYILATMKKISLSKYRGQLKNLQWKYKISRKNELAWQGQIHSTGVMPRYDCKVIFSNTGTILSLEDNAKNPDCAFNR
jgi:hypothetical protein